MFKTISVRDRIRGSLIGGAAGDALGYTVEFFKEPTIFQTYGPKGIEGYELGATGKALISDDTQMTLFTANALLHASKERPEALSRYALDAYRGWYITQSVYYSPEFRIPDDERGHASDLLQDIPELYARRAPGLTCMGAIQRRELQLKEGVCFTSFMQNKINYSKGCGGIMRVAPLGLGVNFWDRERLAVEGAELAAITHSHPLGYVSAACLTLILNAIVYPQQEQTLQQIIEYARDTTADLFRDEPNIQDHTAIINKAIELSKNNDPDLDNIHKLGEGWVAEETLAIAIYCSLKYQNDYSAALVASVNHNGDSDSTGAVTGNILGAWIGYDAIDQKWKDGLELHDLILNIADRVHDDLR